MRKKSHISLARYMVENLKDEELKHHKFSFYLGSILPDIKPSFLYKRHRDGRYVSLCQQTYQASVGGRCADPEEKGVQVLPGSGTDQPLSGGLFYISAQHHLPGQPEGSLFLRGEVKAGLKIVP